MLNLSNKTIAVTGANSMVGRAIIRQLTTYSVTVKSIFHEQYDLMSYDETRTAVNGADYCFHCAGYNGNISFNKKYPADIFYRTTQIGLNVLTACREMGVTKVVSPLASCAYPDKHILKETDWLNGSPNETVEAHGLSKQTIQAYSKQLKKQFDFDSVCVMFSTCYGPYDSFDIQKTKVVGALIKKVYDALTNNEPYIECWGTGSPRRELIYVDDAAQAMINVLLFYDDCSYPLNIGTGKDISIKELVLLIARICEYQGEIRWDTSKPDGQYQKLLDVSKMQRHIDNKTLSEIKFTDLIKGLTQTIEWYSNYVE